MGRLLILLARVLRLLILLLPAVLRLDLLLLARVLGLLLVGVLLGLHLLLRHLLTDLLLLLLLLLLMLLLLLLRVDDLVAHLHRCLVAGVLRLHRLVRSVYLHRPVVAPYGDHVLTVGAAVLGILEPAGHARDTGKADAKEAKDGSNDAIGKSGSAF